MRRVDANNGQILCLRGFRVEGSKMCTNGHNHNITDTCASAAFLKALAAGELLEGTCFLLSAMVLCQ